MLFRSREPSGHHEFDQLCQELGIEHRLTKPRTPRTNGMVERFNGRIADVLKTQRFNSREDMEQTLLRYVALYNHQLPQSALKSKTPMQTMKECTHLTHICFTRDHMIVRDATATPHIKKASRRKPFCCLQGTRNAPQREATLQLQRYLLAILINVQGDGRILHFTIGLELNG